MADLNATLSTGAISAEVAGSVAGTLGGTAGVSAHSHVINEIPTPSVDDSTTVFTTEFNYSHLEVYLNGVEQDKDDDYTESAANQFTMTTAPESTDKLRVDYEIAA